MKKFTILFAIILLPNIINAQSEAISKMINRYGGQEGVTVVNISPELFKMIEGLDVKEFNTAEVPFDKLSQVKILSIENEALLAENDFFEEITSELNTTDFVEVMTVKDGDEDVKMWLNADGKQIRDFLLVVSSPGEGVVVYIKGNFNMNDISGMAESFGGLENIEDFEDTEAIEIH